MDIGKRTDEGKEGRKEGRAQGGNEKAVLHSLHSTLSLTPPPTRALSRFPPPPRRGLNPYSAKGKKDQMPKTM